MRDEKFRNVLLRKLHLGTAIPLRSKLFPINIVSRLVLVYFAILLGYNTYKTILINAHFEFSTSIQDTQVIPDYLKNYGSSSRKAGINKEHTKQSSITGTVHDERGQESESDSGRKESLKDSGNGSSLLNPLDSANTDMLSPRELAEIFVAADIVSERDVADSTALLDIGSGGVGAWLATTLIDTGFQEQDISLLDAMAGAHNDGRVVSTLEVLVRLYRRVGISGEYDGSVGVEDEVAQFADNLSGVAPQLCPFSDRICRALNFITFTDDDDSSVKNVDMASVIKHAMTNEYRLYDARIGVGSYRLHRFEYDRANDSGNDYIRITGERAEDYAVDELNWYQQEPQKLSEALFQLSYLLTNELYRHKEVKSARFEYQAFRGPIQLVLFILIYYLALILVWRFLQALFKFDTHESRWKQHFLIPSLTRGDINDENSERELIRSRGGIDQLINVLPLIGLFGTVWGISGALPNAAAAVSGTGPGASQSVNALFEQLGLAFITTAIAVGGVIIIEYVWQKIQVFEEKAIWIYVHPDNPAPNTEKTELSGYAASNGRNKKEGVDGREDSESRS